MTGYIFLTDFNDFQRFQCVGCVFRVGFNARVRWLIDSLTYYDLSAWEQLTTGIQYASEGHHVFVYFNIAVSLTNSFTTVATLPTGKRPSLNEYFRVTSSNGTGDVTVFVSISGAIQAKVDSGTGSAINGFICIV